jgi:hypothetical protein
MRGSSETLRLHLDTDTGAEVLEAFMASDAERRELHLLKKRASMTWTGSRWVRTGSGPRAGPLGHRCPPGARKALKSAPRGAVEAPSHP